MPELDLVLEVAVAAVGTESSLGTGRGRRQHRRQSHVNNLSGRESKSHTAQQWKEIAK